MPQSRNKFSIIGRSHLSKSLSDLAKPHSSARFSVEYLRPEVRGVLVAVAAGEGIHPEIVRVNLAGCLKLAALRVVVFTIPSKARGLRIQSSDVLSVNQVSVRVLGCSSVMIFLYR